MRTRTASRCEPQSGSGTSGAAGLRRAAGCGAQVPAARLLIPVKRSVQPLGLRKPGPRRCDRRPMVRRVNVIGPGPPPDPRARSAASPWTAATSAAPPPPADARCPRSAPAALPVVLARVQEHVRQRPPHLRRRALQHVVEAVGQNTPPAAEHPVHAARETRRQALHAVRQTLRSRRLDQEVRMVVLNRVVHHPEPGTLRPIAQRLPEGAHEARPAQRRHVVEDAQRDQHRAARRDGAAAAVRDPRAADARPTGSGPCAAAAGRPELDAGLPRLAPTAGLPRPPLAGVPGTMFPLHGVPPLWSCIGKKATRNYCICQQYSASRPRPRIPVTEHRPFQCRCRLAWICAVQQRNIALFPSLPAGAPRPCPQDRRGPCAGPTVAA